MAKKPSKSQAMKEIYSLFEEARKKDTQKYVKLARKTAMKNRIHLPLELKIQFCKKCNNLLTQKTARIRIKNKKRVIICNNCEKKKVIE